MSVGASSLAVLALLAFAVSLVAFLYRTSRHRSSRAWAVAAGGLLMLVLLFGGISNAVSRHADPISGEVRRVLLTVRGIPTMTLRLG